MGQTWSSSGEHVPGCKPIVEMVAPLPKGFSSRAEMRINANTKYPDVGDKVKNTLWNRVWGMFGVNKPEIADSIKLVKDVSRNAGIVLVKETRDFKKLVAERVKKARRRILPGFDGKILDEWLISHIMEDVDLTEVTTMADTVVFAPGLPGCNKMPMFQVDIVVSKRVLEKASGFRTLLGVGITVTEVMPAQKGPFNLHRFSHEQMLDAFNYEREFTEHGRPRPARKVPTTTTVLTADPDAPPARATRSRKRTADGEVKGSKKKESQVETPAAGPPKKRQRKEQQQQQKQQQQQPQPQPAKKRCRRPNAKWTDAERRLLVHFYQGHVKAEKMGWVRAAEVWCSTFGRSDTGVQLEGNRRHWEKKGFTPDATLCTLCQGAQQGEEEEGREEEVKEVKEEEKREEKKEKKKGGGKRKREVEAEEKAEKVEEERTDGLRRSKRIRVGTFKTRQQ